MRNMFVEGELPGETPSRSAGSDISSFAELYQNALDVYAECSEPEVNKPGWYPAGEVSYIIQPYRHPYKSLAGFTDWGIQVT